MLRNNFFKKENKNGILWLSMLLLIPICLFLIPLLTKSYYVSPDSIVKIDTFYLQGRYQSIGRSNRWHYDEYLSLRTKNDYKLYTEELQKSGISDIQKLKDTLMYDNLKFIAYSTKKYLKKYIEEKEPFDMPIYQIQIGDTKYIDIKERNKTQRSKNIVWLLFFSFLDLNVLFLILANNNEKLNSLLSSYSMKIKVIVWCVFFFIVSIALLFLSNYI